MQAVRAIPRLLNQSSRFGAAKNNCTWTASVVSGPPRHPMNKAEKVAFVTIMNSLYLAYPLWVMFHIEDYRGPVESDD